MGAINTILNGWSWKTIISRINHPIEQTAEIEERERDRFVRNLPSFIQDITDFLGKIERMKDNLPQDGIMFTMDIKLLYLSVPKE